MNASEITSVLIGLFVGWIAVSATIHSIKERKRPRPEGNQNARSGRFGSANPGSSENAKERTQSAHSAAGSGQSESQGARRHWYTVLGLSSTASVEDIRASYRALMGQYHPDKVATLGLELRELAERKSKEIGAAYREAMSLRQASR